MRLPTILTSRKSADANERPRPTTEIPIATITPSSPVASLAEHQGHPPSRPLAWPQENEHQPQSEPAQALSGLASHGLATSASRASLHTDNPYPPGSVHVLPSESSGSLPGSHIAPPSPPLRPGGPPHHAHFEQDPSHLTVDYSRRPHVRSSHVSLDMGGNGTERSKSPAPSAGSRAPPESFADLTVLYSVVAERRNSFDALLWQVPATSLTGHAFLFSIALAPDTSKFARIASMGLSILISCLTLHLFTRQLQAEDADHMWLADFEERHGIDFDDRAHGDRWKFFRHRKPRGAGWLGWLALHRSFPLWRNGWICIGSLALSIIIITIVNENVLLGFNCQPFATN